MRFKEFLGSELVLEDHRSMAFTYYKRLAQEIMTKVGRNIRWRNLTPLVFSNMDAKTSGSPPFSDMFSGSELVDMKGFPILVAVLVSFEMPEKLGQGEVHSELGSQTGMCFQTNDGRIGIRAEFIVDLDESVLSKLYDSLSVLFHEMVHAFQHVTLPNGTGGTSGRFVRPEKGETQRWKTDTNQIFRNAEAMWAYLVSPREVDAFVRECYLQSKRSRQPIHDIIESKVFGFFERFYMDFTVENIESYCGFLDKLCEDVTQKWLAYARRIFPAITKNPYYIQPTPSAQQAQE